MVLRIKQFIKKHAADVLVSLILTCIVMYPYLIRSFTPVEHDTFFHISRIEQLSKAIRNGQFLPAVYPEENFGFGYASPLFYSDFFLIIPALLRVCGMPVSMCYRLSVSAAVLISSLTMTALVFRVSKKRNAAWLASAAYLFSNYRITDIYVRGALGEIFSFAALPAVLCGMYRILYEEDTEGWFTLTLGLSALALCHNLTFALGALLCAILFVIRIRYVNKEIFNALFKGVGFAFLITSFYTLPMIEQLGAQNMIVKYYGSSSDLGAYSIDFWQYFANRTVFALAGNSLPHDQTMLVNIGYFLQFVPLLYLFVKKEKRNSFVMHALILGYIFMLLPSSLLPWDALFMFRILQFPWRLNTLAMVLLAVPAAAAVSEIAKKDLYILGVIAVLSAECVWHVNPVLLRTFGISDDMTWQDVLDGKLCDPCYSADYVRVELAGGDYLPWPHPDYRTQSREVLYMDGSEAGIELKRAYSYMSLDLDSSSEDILVLPVTWYKGWTVYKTDGVMKLIGSFRTDDGLLAFRPQGKGSYMILFSDTPLRRMCTSLSLISLVFMYMTKRRIAVLPYLKR